MICKYKIKLGIEKDIPPKHEWGYRLYSALLEKSPLTLANDFHKNEITPISQFLQIDNNSIYWNISLFGKEAINGLSDILQNTEKYHLSSGNVDLKVQNITTDKINDLDDILQKGLEHSSVFDFDIHTPTAFKSQGKYISLPTNHLIVQSLIKKWNMYFPYYQIDDEDGQGISTLSSGLIISDFNLKSQKYWLKQNPITGAVGKIVLVNSLAGFHKQLLNSLLLFADYSGLGIKNTLGMGGISLKK